MSDIHQVWEGHDGWKALGLHYFVHQDFDEQPDIENAFDFVVSARVLGAQLGSATRQPLGNGPVSIQTPAGTIVGQIDDWQGYDPSGNKALWNAGGLSEARFVLTLDIDVAVGPFGRVKVKAFHKPCVVLLHWNSATGKYQYMPS